jgi:hypothetical protein
LFWVWRHIRKKKGKSVSSIKDNIKKIAEFSFNADGNLDIKRPTIEKPNLSLELNAPVLETAKREIKILPSI